MRKADSNEGPIVAALRAVGCEVELIEGASHRWGTRPGVPDLLVRPPRANACGCRPLVLMEVKVPGGRLTEAQRAWHDRWRGHVVVVHTVEEALAAVGLLARAA